MPFKAVADTLTSESEKAFSSLKPASSNSWLEELVFSPSSSTSPRCLLSFSRGTVIPLWITFGINRHLNAADMVRGSEVSYLGSMTTQEESGCWMNPDRGPAAGHINREVGEET